MALVNKNAAILIKESDLDSSFEKEFSELIASEEKQKALSGNIKTMEREIAKLEKAAPNYWITQLIISY